MMDTVLENCWAKNFTPAKAVEKCHEFGYKGVTVSLVERSYKEQDTRFEAYKVLISRESNEKV